MFECELTRQDKNAGSHFATADAEPPTFFIFCQSSVRPQRGALKKNLNT